MVSYCRIVSLLKSILIPLCVFIQTLSREKTGIYFIDLLVMEVCHIKRANQHRVFRDLIKRNMKNKLMPMIDKILLRKRAFIETVNDQLKNISQIEARRHRSIWNFLVNILGALAAYALQPKKPSLNLSNTSILADYAIA